MLLEMLFSVLLAPVRMLFHTVFVTAAFLGWSVQWNSPQRDDDATPWSEAFKRHGSQILLGLIWTAGVAWLDPRFLWWLSPIVVSLMLSAVVSVVSSRTNYGLAARRSSLFLIPEEYNPPRELVATEEYLQQNNQTVLRHGFLQAVVDPVINALACGMAKARHAKIVPQAETLRQQRLEKVLADGPENHSNAQWAILSDPVGMSRLHLHVWQSGDARERWVEAYRRILPLPVSGESSALSDGNSASLVPSPAR
jgi:membrane glycosyltransferase